MALLSQLIKIKDALLMYSHSLSHISPLYHVFTFQSDCNLGNNTQQQSAFGCWQASNRDRRLQHQLKRSVFTRLHSNKFYAEVCSVNHREHWEVEFEHREQFFSCWPILVDFPSSH